MDVITDVLVAAVSSPFILLVVFLVCLLDGVFPPIPSDMVLVGAVAVALSATPASLIPLVLVAAGGAILGDNIAYELGRRMGTTRYRWMRSRAMQAAFARAESQMARRAPSLIITGRYVPVGRIVVSVTAGSVGLGRRRFVPLSIIAGLSWSVYTFTIAVIASVWISDNPLLGAVIAVVFAVALGVAIDRLTTRRLARQS